MMKTIDDLDPVSYQMLMQLLHDVFSFKGEVLELATSGKLVDWHNANVKFENASNEVKAFVSKHKLYNGNWKQAILNLTYVYGEREDNSEKLGSRFETFMWI